MHLRSLCFRDIFCGKGHGTTALIGLNSDGGCVALCYLGGHKDFIVVVAVPAFEWSTALSIVELRGTCGEDKLLLLLGICTHGAKRLQRAARNDIAVLIFYVAA